MSPFIVSLMFAAGASTWIYTRFQRTSGNNTSRSAMAAGVCGLVILFIFYTVFKMITGS